MMTFHLLNYIISHQKVTKSKPKLHQPGIIARLF